MCTSSTTTREPVLIGSLSLLERALSLLGPHSLLSPIGISLFLLERAHYLSGSHSLLRDPSPYWPLSLYWRQPSLYWAPILYWEPWHYSAATTVCAHVCVRLYIYIHANVSVSAFSVLHSSVYIWVWHTKCGYIYICVYVQPIPLGVSFSKAQSSKLERIFCHVSVKRDVRAFSFQLWNSIRKCGPKWDWLYVNVSTFSVSHSSVNIWVRHTKCRYIYICVYTRICACIHM